MSDLAHSVDDLVTDATVRGDAFVFSTTSAGAIPSVAAGSFLNVVLTNNNATRKALIFERRFDNSVAYNAASVTYGGIGSPSALASPAVSYGGQNLNDSYAASPDLLFSSGVYTTRLNNAAANAVPASMGFLPIGDVLKLMQPRVLGPNKSFGQFLTGQASGLGAVQLNLTMYVLLLPLGY